MNDNDKVEQICAGVSQPTGLWGLQRSSGTGDFIDDVDLTKLVTISHNVTAGNGDNHAVVWNMNNGYRSWSQRSQQRSQPTKASTSRRRPAQTTSRWKYFQTVWATIPSFFSGPKMLWEQVPSFENFFDDDSIGSYLRNPFGEDFIKLEIDQKSFRTNKTKVSTAEYFPCDPLH